MLRILSSTKTRRYFSQISLIIVAVLFSIGLQTFAAGSGFNNPLSVATNAQTFKEPAKSPPYGNAYAPLNTGTTTQTKVGNLILKKNLTVNNLFTATKGAIINTGNAQTGLIVAKGNVGIGTLTPTSKLDVKGDIAVSGTINVKQICLNGSCKTKWTAPVTAPAPAPLPPAKTYLYTGNPVAYTVAANVNSVKIQAWGAQGGRGSGSSAGSGGNGGYAIGTRAVSPGETLYVYVGGTNGWNGGGTTTGLGGGGGASDVRIGTALNKRVIVAGGGGGGGGYNFSVAGGTGGTGGGSVGGVGGVGGSYAASGGTGGSGSTGGSTGGGFGYGGGSIGFGGAGGGGMWGGGAGVSGFFSGAGGGGGSGYIGGVTSGSMSNGVQSGNGKVTITPLP